MRCRYVVVVEDDPDIRETIRSALELEGYTVRDFPNGQLAIEALGKEAGPCLILLDLMMPVMNGWEFLESRKTMGESLVSIPVVVVSAVAGRGHVVEGVEGFLKKPIDLDVLIDTVRAHCGSAEAA